MPHETLSFAHPSQPTQVVASQLTIQQKQRWTDDWIDMPNATLDFAVWAAAPSVGRAQITYRYGYGKQPGSLVFAPINYLDMSRRFIRICLEFDSEALTGGWVTIGGQPVVTIGGTPLGAWSADDIGLCWIGQCEVVAKIHHGTLETPSGSVPSGEVTAMAYGMEQLLEQHRVHYSYWLNNTTVEVAHAGFTFNEKLTDTFNVEGKGNRSNTKPAGLNHYVFSDAADAQIWRTRDIIEYLIRSTTGIPLNHAGADVVEWKISDADLDLLPDWDKPELESHYVSTKQLFDALISRRRLLTWWCEVDENDSDRIAVRVASFTDAPISLPGNSAEIPANTTTVDLDFEFDMAAEIVQQVDTAHAKDQVIAYGARRRNTFTCNFAVASSILNEIFTPAWTTGMETTYEAGGSGAAGYPAAGEIADRRNWLARARAREEVKDVFKRWQLRRGVSHPDPDSYLAWMAIKRIQKTLPFYKGVDYTSGSIASGAWTYPNVGTGRLEERDPYLVIKIPGTSDEYVDLSQLGRSGRGEVVNEQDVRDWSATVTIPHDGHSIKVDVVGAPQHTIAHGTFTGQAEDEKDHGEWDWRTILATISITEERFAEGRYPADSSIPNTVDAKRVIRVPAGAQYKLDWVASDTVVDLNPDGTLKQISAAGYLNDSRNDLEDVAKAAYAWYSKTRNALTVRTDWQPPAQNLKIGKYVTYLLIDGTPIPIGALISQLEIQAYAFTGQEPRADLPPIKLQITTAFGELDFLHLRSGKTKKHARKKAFAT